MRKRSCVHIRSYTSDQHKSFNANQWPRDFSRHLRKKKEISRLFLPLFFFFKVSNRWVHKLQKKKWRAWFTEGCNWRWVNRWKEPSSLFLKWLCHAYYPTTLPPKKIRLKKKSKKKSVIVRIRSLCCMRYGWIKAGYLGQGVLFIYLFFLSLNRRKRTGCVRSERGGRENRNVISGWTLSGPTCCPTRPSPIDGQLFFLT